MGCWRATCGLSNLPIHENDEVVAFLLKEKSLSELRGGQFHAVDDLYIPISAPIIGKYDGYGSIKDIDEKYSDLILKQVRSFFKENISSDTLSIKSNTSSIDIEVASIEDIVYEFERGNIIQVANKEIIELYAQSGEFHKGYYFTGLILFHKDIYDKLINLKSSSNLFKENYTLANNFKQIDLKKQVSNEKFELLMNQIVYESRLPHSEHKYFDVYMYWYSKEDSVSINLELLDYLRNGLLISSIMEDLNKSWMPQKISSQLNNNYDTFKKLNEIIINKINDSEKKEEENHDRLSSVNLDALKSIAEKFNVDL